MRDNNKIYKEEKIIDLLSSMRSYFFDLEFLNEEEKLNNYQYHSNPFHYEKKADIEEKFKDEAWQLYNLCTVYFESLNLKEYLTAFKKDMISQLEESLFENKYSNEDTIPYSITVSKFSKYLVPFEFSQGSYIDRLLKQAGIIYLENILRNTQSILNKIGVKPESETSLYNEIKFVIESTFSKSLSPTSRFFKCFKNYNPDILIPDLQVAIEYKYAKSESALKNQIDQVISDIKGYTGDINYKIFYAVFYVTKDFWGAPRFEEAIKEMDFPMNWKCIYVVGN
ncbi:hypothetical protein ACQ7CX_12845 [Chryseobacterium arthrosphaerae]|uniref:hypothetical protein n=1 Tax=Chryseobacterium arthrosphaerae TaxID=651561 RepID=UPI001BB047A9|nr:hypothetical protein [Chryseobacterium arthrosphaerae]QUY54316.1 hypothetical protein I2F65_15665 [Chryseobacterium arthrosphaerae]